MRSSKQSLRLPHSIADAGKRRAESISYPSFSSYVIGLIRYDLIARRDHHVTLPLAKLPLPEQDAIDDMLLEIEKDGKGVAGSLLEHLVSDAIKDGAAPEPVQVMQDLPTLLKRRAKRVAVIGALSALGLGALCVAQPVESPTMRRYQEAQERLEETTARYNSFKRSERFREDVADAFISIEENFAETQERISEARIEAFKKFEAVSESVRAARSSIESKLDDLEDHDTSIASRLTTLETEVAAIRKSIDEIHGIESTLADLKQLLESIEDQTKTP